MCECVCIWGGGGGCDYVCTLVILCERICGLCASYMSVCVCVCVFVCVCVCLSVSGYFVVTGNVVKHGTGKLVE